MNIVSLATTKERLLELPVGIKFSEDLLTETRESVTNLREAIARTEQEIEGFETRISELERDLKSHDGIHQKCDEQKRKLMG